MEIQALKLFLTEDEANEMVAQVLPNPEPIEELRVRLTPDGLIVQGVYPAMMFKTSFEMLWHLSPSGPELVARLVSVKMAGISAGMLKGVLMRMIRDAVKAQPWVRVQDEVVRVHIVEAARAQGVPLRVQFSAVRCSFASLVLEAGNVS